MRPPSPRPLRPQNSLNKGGRAELQCAQLHVLDVVRRIVVLVRGLRAKYQAESDPHTSAFKRIDTAADQAAFSYVSFWFR